MKCRLPLALVLTGAVLLGACELLPPSDDYHAVTVRLRGHHFSMSTDTLAYVLHNTSADTLYYSACFPTTVEEYDGRQLRATATLPVCLCECPTPLFPDERQLMIAVRPDTWDMLTGDHLGGDSLSLAPEHTYRLHLGLAFYESVGFEGLVQRAPLVTRRFTLAE